MSVQVRFASPKVHRRHLLNFKYQAAATDEGFRHNFIARRIVQEIFLFVFIAYSSKWQLTDGNCMRFESATRHV